MSTATFTSGPCPSPCPAAPSLRMRLKGGPAAPPLPSLLPLAAADEEEEEEEDCAADDAGASSSSELMRSIISFAWYGLLTPVNVLAPPPPPPAAAAAAPALTGE